MITIEKHRKMKPANVRLAWRVLDGETIRAVAEDAGLHPSRIGAIVDAACLRLFLAGDFEKYGKPIETIEDYRAMWRNRDA